MSGPHLGSRSRSLDRKSNHANVNGTRAIFECLYVKFLGQMQQFFTRFLTFEQAHGTPQREKVKERARAFVESKIALVANSAQP